METVKGKPFFCHNFEKIKSYPYLGHDAEVDVLIIGGGIDGAIANYFLSLTHDVMLVDKSRFGLGCTSCATALLEYQLDDFAEDLEGEMTTEEIVRVYKMGLESIDKIEEFVKKHGNYCEFKRCPTFMFSSNLFQAKKIEREYEFRKSNGFNCELLTKNNNPFMFEFTNGLYCKDGGCEFNPYLFTKQMIENSKNQDKIFENTNISEILKTDSGLIATTNYGEKINCKKIVVATGFNWEVLNKNDICKRFVSYTIVTKPIEGLVLFESSLVQDSGDPYHYLRMLPNGGLIFGGEDTSFSGGEIDEKKATKKYDKLLKDLGKLFPTFASRFEIETKFCGLFGSTDNNMGKVGKYDHDGIFLFISCGANGIINAMFGTTLLDDLFSSKENDLEKIFAPNR